MERCRRQALEMMAEQGLENGYEVWQHEGADRGYRHVGFMPNIPRQATSGITQIRPGDFRWGEIEGKRVILAIWSICPGDWANIPGFVRSDGSRPERTVLSEHYDQLASFGADRTTALETVIKRALR
jgi:hypothetical protein